MIDMGCAHPEWFKKKKSISRDAVETFYRKCLQESKGDYPPSVRVKVIEGESEGKNTIIREVYTAEGDSEESYDIGNSYTIVPNTDVMCVIRIASVWFVARHDFAQHCYHTLMWIRCLLMCFVLNFVCQGGSYGLSLTAKDILAWPPTKQEDTFPFQLPFKIKKRKRGGTDDNEIDVKKMCAEPQGIMPKDEVPFNGGLTEEIEAN